jgi:CHASE1-domain containing sensor protein
MWQMPELHPLHYAREVRGWIETAVPLAFNRKAMGRDCYKQEIQQMAEDPYFRNAFEKMDTTKLSKNRLTLAKCLYKRNYRRFELFCEVFRLTDAVRCRLKRFISLP